MANKLTLSDLEVGAVARVLAYGDQTLEYARQLTRLGLIPGTTLSVERRAPLGDPVEIRFRGFSLALRPSEAQSLLLERV